VCQTPGVNVPEPTTFEVAESITAIDTGTAGLDAFNSVYVIAGEEPVLVEAASAADASAVEAGLAAIGLGPNDLAHVVVTHIHLDHAGGVGVLLRRYPRATAWVHERGAAHLADPSRLVASTARTYGEERMRALYGETLPVDAARIRAVGDTDRISFGRRHLDVVHTPGHASHHVALRDSATGAVFTGEAVGSHLPWADAYRPALPPPEVDVEQALASIERIRGLRASMLLTSHFGPIPDADEGCTRAAERVQAWSETVRRALLDDPALDQDAVAEILTEQAGREYLQDAGVPIDLPRYDAIGSIRMNAGGLARYWRKRWEGEGGGAPTTLS
jgi:glyoxylase-like metal-dependent hydrolase (beta-lactamase superfamily II)